MYEIDGCDFNILTAFNTVDEDGETFLDKPAYGATISMIMDYLEGIRANKSRKTIYLHMVHLVETGYVAEGIKYNHATSYYITEKGKNALKGDL